MIEAYEKYRKCHGNRNGQVFDPDLGDLDSFPKMASELVSETCMSRIFFRKNWKEKHSKEKEVAGESTDLWKYFPCSGETE